jgi:enterochelin esterase-like enzyme
MGVGGRWSAAALLLAVVMLLTVGAGSAGAAEPVGSGLRVSSTTESRFFWSPTLGRLMPYFVYLPPGYSSSSDRRYPVLYMLHGMGGSNSEWRGYGLLEAADALMQAREIHPFLIVLPQGDQGDWVDQANGPQWATYLSHDVVEDVDHAFWTRPDREHRAVGGLSMGATGALVVALRFPDVFGIVGAHTPTPRDWDGEVAYLGPEMAADYYGDRARFTQHNPVDLFRQLPGVAASLRIWIDAGDQDIDWLPAAEALHEQLDAEGIAHSWHVLAGHHNGDDYWGPHAGKYLRFYDAALGS